MAELRRIDGQRSSAEPTTDLDVFNDALDDDIAAVVQNAPELDDDRTTP